MSGGWGRAFISSVLYVELIGTCGLFFILEGDHLALLFDGASPQTLMLLSAPILIGKRERPSRETNSTCESHAESDLRMDRLFHRYKLARRLV